jgi:hypothetical protein
MFEKKAVLYGELKAKPNTVALSPSWRPQINCNFLNFFWIRIPDLGFD